MENMRQVKKAGVRLNSRGKMVIWATVATTVAGAVFALMPIASAQSDVSATVNYTVQPGDTLWSYASSITPHGEDIYETMDQIKQLNNLESDQLHAGQSLQVPVK